MLYALSILVPLLVSPVSPLVSPPPGGAARAPRRRTITTYFIFFLNQKTGENVNRSSSFYFFFFFYPYTNMRAHSQMPFALGIGSARRWARADRIQLAPTPPGAAPKVLRADAHVDKQGWVEGSAGAVVSLYVPSIYRGTCEGWSLKMRVTLSSSSSPAISPVSVNC